MGRSGTCIRRSHSTYLGAAFNPALVVRDANGQIYTVRYGSVNAMLLSEFLKEHHKVVEQACKMEKQDRRIAEREATVAKQQDNFTSTIAQQQKEIAALTSQIQKVSAQLEMSKAAPQLVANDQ